MIESLANRKKQQTGGKPLVCCFLERSAKDSSQNAARSGLSVIAGKFS
jgi:hypothetical protein